MSNITPAITTPISKFAFYEDLAASSSSDSTVVYSTPEGVGTVDTEEVIDHQKAREDFNKAVTEKFPKILDYRTSLSNKSDSARQCEPLTLGQIREVIKKVSSEEYQVRNTQDSQLATLMGSLILANEEAARAEAHIDSLGYPREHIDAVASAAGKLILDSGITLAALGLGGYTVITALVASAGAGWSPSIIMGGGALSRTSAPGETPVSRLITAGLLMGLTGGGLAALGAHAATSGILVSGAAGTAALIGLNPEIGKKVGQAIAAILPDVGTSFEKTKGAVSKLTEAQTALLNAVITRVVANECKKAVSEYTKTKAGALTNLASEESVEVGSPRVKMISPVEEETTQVDLQKLSDAAKEGFDQIQKLKTSTPRLPQELTNLLQRSEVMKSDAQALLEASPLSQEKLQEFTVLVQSVLEAIEQPQIRSKRNLYISSFKAKAEEALGLAQKLTTTSAPEPGLSPEEISLTYEDFLRAVEASWKTGTEKERKLKERSEDENDLLRLKQAFKGAVTALGNISATLDPTTRMINKVRESGPQWPLPGEFGGW